MACETNSRRPLSRQQEIVFAALLKAIEGSAEAWASAEEVAAAGGPTLRQTRRSLRGLRAREKVGMIYPETRGRYRAPADNIVYDCLQERAWDRYAK